MAGITPAGGGWNRTAPLRRQVGGNSGRRRGRLAGSTGRPQRPTSSPCESESSAPAGRNAWQAVPVRARQRRRRRLPLHRKPSLLLLLCGQSTKKRCVSSNNSPTPVTRRQKNAFEILWGKWVCWGRAAATQNTPETPNVAVSDLQIQKHQTWLSDLQTMSKTDRRCAVPDPKDPAGSARFLPRCLDPCCFQPGLLGRKIAITSSKRIVHNFDTATLHYSGSIKLILLWQCRGKAGQRKEDTLFIFSESCS